jgi:hypothetical protein
MGLTDVEKRLLKSIPCHGSACPSYRMCYNIPFAITGSEFRSTAKAQFDNFCAGIIMKGKLKLSGGDN